MIAAVHTFNSGGLFFRAELFIVTSIIAWTYLITLIISGKALTIVTKRQVLFKKQNMVPTNTGSLANAWRTVIAPLRRASLII